MQSLFMLILLGIFLREINFKDHTEHSHASFVFYKTSEKVEIMSTIDTCNNS